MTPLHQAVINGDITAVSKLCSSTDMISSTDALGFTPLELSQLLGQYKCMELLGCRPDKRFLVQIKTKASPQTSLKAPSKNFSASPTVHSSIFRPTMT
jgi:hypothetical protein